MLDDLIEDLPVRQRETLDFIVGHTRIEGLPPTLGQIADHLDLASRSNAHAHVVALERKGLLDKRPVRGMMAYWPAEGLE